MDLTSIISLTPDFSRVFRATHVEKPFQRFFNVWLKAVETALTSSGTLTTWLKPGVNDSGTSRETQAI